MARVYDAGTLPGEPGYGDRHIVMGREDEIDVLPSRNLHQRRRERVVVHGGQTSDVVGVHERAVVINRGGADELEVRGVRQRAVDLEPDLRTAREHEDALRPSPRRLHFRHVLYRCRVTDSGYPRARRTLARAL